jgi:hypothetical protein
MRKENKYGNRIIGITYLIILILLISSYAYSDPMGFSIISNDTETAPTTPAASLATAGGTFTTMVLNGSFQTQKWKAYVGNVTGAFSLSDSSNNTIYDWTFSTVNGEVYVSRNNSVTWADIRCANTTDREQEDVALNMLNTSVANINNTFNDSVHRAFNVGTVSIPASNCSAIATFINNTRQAPAEDADFQEVLLHDDNSLIYVALMEEDTLGYNVETYDFQMIVAEDETTSTATTYYFWVEIS